MKPLTWETLDWDVLDRLRETFLAAQPGGGAYWNSLEELANYDFTYAQRIGWKWDAALDEVQSRGWTPPPGPLLDWGCGSGMAGRRVLERFGEAAFSAVALADHSPLAVEFAARVLREEHPRLRIHREADASRIGTLVVSHVLNELDEADGRALRQCIDRADAVLWVEPGTHADSRALIAMREALREDFQVIAPCTHQAACDLLAPQNGRHWCHHFAPPPKGIMADSNWVRFARRAGIDLRSVPYSFLILERRGLRERAPAPGLLPEGWIRVIGEPRIYKAFARILSCRAEGVCDLELQKRDAPALFKAVKAGEAPRLIRGEDDGLRFSSIEETH